MSIFNQVCIFIKDWCYTNFKSYYIQDEILNDLKLVLLHINVTFDIFVNCQEFSGFLINLMNIFRVL